MCTGIRDLFHRHIFAASIFPQLHILYFLPLFIPYFCIVQFCMYLCAYSFVFVFLACPLLIIMSSIVVVQPYLRALFFYVNGLGFFNPQPYSLPNLYQVLYCIVHVSYIYLYCPCVMCVIILHIHCLFYCSLLYFVWCPVLLSSLCFTYYFFVHLFLYLWIKYCGVLFLLLVCLPSAVCVFDFSWCVFC